LQLEYIKMGGRLVWDCCNIYLESDMKLFVLVPWRHLLMRYNLIADVKQERTSAKKLKKKNSINPLNPELNPIC